MHFTMKVTCNDDTNSTDEESNQHEYVWYWWF